MGVNLYILDRRYVTLSIDDGRYQIGTLRLAGKLTEQPRTTDSVDLHNLPMPVAVLVAEPNESRSFNGDTIGAHVILGWDEDRNSVSDLGWDHLPILGYGVRDPSTGIYVLYNLRNGTLHPVPQAEASAKGLIDGGRLIRMGQPTIAACDAVRPLDLGSPFAEADCVLSDGRQASILVELAGETLPDPAWLIGKRPMDVTIFP